MKQYLLIMVACLSLSSCATEEKAPENPITNVIKEPVIIARPRIYSDVILSTATTNAPLTECYNQTGDPFQIISTDQLKILFFDMEYKSQELTIPVPATLGDLLAQITNAAAAKGAIISFSPDTLGKGQLVITASGTAIRNLSVINITNPNSSAKMKSTFLWDGPIKTGHHSIGSCLMVADQSSSLLSLRDKKGGLLGLELGDSIYLEGKTPAGNIGRSFSLKVDSTNPSLGSLISLIGSAVPGSSLSIGGQSSSKEAGKLIVELPGALSNYYLNAKATNSDNDYVGPSKFHATFAFKSL